MTAVETTKESWCEADILRIAGETALESPQPEAAKAQEYFERAGASSSRACCVLPWSRQSRAMLIAARSSRDFACCSRATASA
jgi:hypothetical protein